MGWRRKRPCHPEDIHQGRYTNRNMRTRGMVLPQLARSMTKADMDTGIGSTQARSDSQVVDGCIVDGCTGNVVWKGLWTVPGHSASAFWILKAVYFYMDYEKLNIQGEQHIAGSYTWQCLFTVFMLCLLCVCPTMAG